MTRTTPYIYPLRDTCEKIRPRWTDPTFLRIRSSIAIGRTPLRLPRYPSRCHEQLSSFLESAALLSLIIYTKRSSQWPEHVVSRFADTEREDRFIAPVYLSGKTVFNLCTSR
jgi:hypothetical protein